MVLPEEKRNFPLQFIAPLISFHTFNLQEIIFSAETFGGNNSNTVNARESKRSDENYDIYILTCR